MTENEIAKEIVDVAFKLHSTYGPGLLESVYESIMAYELSKRGLAVSRQQAIPLVHESIKMNVGFVLIWSSATRLWLKSNPLIRLLQYTGSSY